MAVLPYNQSRNVWFGSGTVDTFGMTGGETKDIALECIL